MKIILGIKLWKLVEEKGKEHRLEVQMAAEIIISPFGMSAIQGHLVNSNTFRSISHPVGICHRKSRTFIVFNAMWRLLAVSLPFCIAGARAAAAAHSTVIAVDNKENQLRSMKPLLVRFGHMISLELYCLNFPSRNTNFTCSSKQMGTWK